LGGRPRAGTEEAGRIVLRRKRSPTDGGPSAPETGVQRVDHEALLLAATGILQEQGLLALTAPALAARLRVPEHGLVVDLDALVAEAYRGLGVEELASVRRIVLANPSPVEQMRALLKWLATPPEDSDAIRLEAWVLSRHNPALRSAVQDGEAAWHGLVAAVIRRGARSGDFPPADAEDVAAHVISLIDGINAYQLIGYRSDFDRMRLLTRVLRAELGLAWGSELEDALG
jgi:AcrR family transcriptional regulator